MTPELTQSDLAGIAAVLIEAGVDVTGPLAATFIPGGRSNLTYLLEDGISRWVMRTPPRFGRTPSAHDVGREYRVTSALAGTAVPVPPPIVLCGDDSIIGGPFAVACFVAGTTIRSQADLVRLGDEDLGGLLRHLLGCLAALHGIDHRAVGLETFGRSHGYAARQVRRWAAQWEMVGDTALDALAREVIRSLERSVPEQRAVSIVHGDYRIDNTLVAPREDGPGYHVAAIVDWELSTIGDPVADVATMCAYRHPAFDLIIGEPSAWTSERIDNTDEICANYRAAGGAELTDWDFHLALAHFKIAVIAAGIEHRRRVGASSGRGFDTAGQAVEPYLGTAAHHLGIPA